MANIMRVENDGTNISTYITMMRGENGAFTDYRAEGQTICPVIVDIGRPPSGGISPFNISSKRPQFNQVVARFQ